ncbi:MAG TPA: hypothetical protein VMW75_04970 [Thermoanaerobaculia bacterium]|nr:hypothetical protein [Thermoanaerobaculia bacterium]
MRAESRHPSRARFATRARPGRVPAMAAAGLLGLYLAVAVPKGLWRAGGEVADAVDDHESPDQARRRLFGDSYTDAIDEIRRALPAGEGYLMVEGGSGMLGGTYWVRYDLAPRRAVYLGRLNELTSAQQVRRRLVANLRHVVVAFGSHKPPRLYDRFRFLQEIDRRARAGSAVRGGPGSDR